MKRWLSGLLYLVLSGAALAAGPDAVRERVQASMLVTGMIEVAPDGSVAKYTLDHPEKLPSEVRGLLAQAVPVWKFEPVEVGGKPVIAKTSMNLRVVAKPLGNDSYSMSVAGVSFGDYASDAKHDSAETITYKNRVQPSYPLDARDSGVSGIVYVLLKVGRDGRVADSAAEQVNLRIIADESQLAVWRRILASAALNAVKRWTFNPPTVGKDADKPCWMVRTSVNFVLSGPGAPAVVRESGYGQWQPYVPGPVQEPTWSEKRKLAGSVDTVPDGRVFLANASLHLLTPLGGT